MNVAELRAELISEINQADEGLLFEIQQVIDHHVTHGIPEAVLESINISKQQLNEGKGIAHDEVMKMAKEWLKK